MVNQAANLVGLDSVACAFQSNQSNFDVGENFFEDHSLPPVASGSSIVGDGISLSTVVSGELSC